MRGQQEWFIEARDCSDVCDFEDEEVEANVPGRLHNERNSKSRPAVVFFPISSEIGRVKSG